MEGAHPICSTVRSALHTPQPFDPIFGRCCSVHARCHVFLNRGRLILAGGKLLITGTIRHLDSERDRRYGGR